jgi:Tfp pilus assembly protein PilE
VLGAVGVVLALLILPSFQKWLVQRSQIESARAAVSRSQRDVAALTKQRARWADDDYVKAQASARLNYVTPGETQFVVVDPKGSTTPPVNPSDDATNVPAVERPWFARVWLSAQVAADPTGTGK